MPGRSGTTGHGAAGGGVQPAMVRAHSRAFAWSIPGNRCRNSMMADSSPSSWKAVRIAAASASVTTNIAEAWGMRLVAGKHGYGLGSLCELLGSAVPSGNSLARSG